MGIDKKTLALAKSYTDKSMQGAGAVAGKPCQIQNIEDITGGHRVTFLWVDNAGTSHTSAMDVKDGIDAVQISNIVATDDNKIKVIMADGTEYVTTEIPTVQGEEGKSAYEVAVEQGYSGTEEEWLASLKGEQGDAGEGVPEGGTAGQVLVKKSNTDYDTEWDTPAGGGDMLKSVYDTDNDGKVDSAENADTVGGHTVAKDVPADAKFTDTVYDDTEIRGDIADKVDKVTGKDLSTNDYSDADKAIVDGVTSALAGKADVADLPSKTSDLTNDSGFITKAVNDLVNYYLKSETYSKTEVDDIVTTIKNSRFEVVATLPTTDIKTNVIYLVPKSPSQTSNVKDEYINLDGTTSGWEKIGDTEIDLSDYVTTQALNTALEDYTTTADLTTLLAAKQDALTFDNAPTENSNNPVKSGGVYTANQNIYEVMGINGAKNLVDIPDFTLIKDTDRTKSVDIRTLPKRPYICSFDVTDASDPINGQVQVFDINSYAVGGVTITENGHYSFPVSADHNDYRNIYAYINSTLADGTTMKISNFMIRHASDTDSTYQSYAKTNKELTAENQTLTNNVDVLFETGVKNICPPYSGSFSSNGITYIGNSDGTVTANGTCSANVGTNIRVYLKAGQYKVSGCPSGGSYSTYRIGVTTDSWTLIGTHDFGNGTTITIPSDGYYRINLDVREGYVANNLVFKPMITDVDTPESDYDHYVPYAKTNRQLMEDSVDWRSNSVLGAKNFLTNKGTATTQGVEFAVDSNGVFTVTRKSAGSSHAYYSNGTFDLPAGTYIFSNGYDTLPSGIQATYLYNRTDSAYFINCNNGPKMFTLTSAKTLAFNIEVQTTQSPSGVKIYPMIRLASDNDATYQPYAKTNRELTEAVDGMMMKVGRYTKTVKGTNTTYGALIDQICADMKTMIDGFADTNTKVIPMSITIDGLVTLFVRSDQYKKGDNFNIVAYCASCDGTTFNTFYLRGLSGSGNSTIYRQDVTASSQAINDLTSTSFTGDKNISLTYDRYQII
jgi:hypothetical protein